MCKVIDICVAFQFKYETLCRAATTLANFKSDYQNLFIYYKINFTLFDSISRL